MWYICIYSILLLRRKKGDILTSVTLTDLGNIMLSRISQNKNHMIHSHVGQKTENNKEMKQTNTDDTSHLTRGKEGGTA